MTKLFLIACTCLPHAAAAAIVGSMVLEAESSAAKALPIPPSNSTVARAERVAGAPNEVLKDKAALAGRTLEPHEYAEARASAGVMHRKDEDAESCGTAYCDDLVHYKPELMRESQFLDQCLAAHREWEHAADYSLECPHTKGDDCGGVECPINVNAQRHQQLLDLLEHTRHLIEERREKVAQRQAHLYAKDSIADKKATAREDADIAEGQKQRRMAKALEKVIDIRAYQRKKHNSMKVKVRCKDGNIVGNVYLKGGNAAKRNVECTQAQVHAAETIPEQGYLRTQSPGK